MLLSTLFLVAQTPPTAARHRDAISWEANASVNFKAGASQVGFNERVSGLAKAEPNKFHIQMIHKRLTNEVDGKSIRVTNRDGLFAEIRFSPTWIVPLPAWDTAKFMPPGFSDAMKFTVPNRSVGKATFQPTISNQPGTGSVWFVKTRTDRFLGPTDVWEFTVSGKGVSIKGELEVNQLYSLATKLHLTMENAPLPNKPGKKGTLELSYGIVGVS